MGYCKNTNLPFKCHERPDSSNASVNSHQIAITETEVSGSDGMERVIPEGAIVDKVVADGIYYSTERCQSLSDADRLARAPSKRQNDPDWNRVFAGLRINRLAHRRCAFCVYPSPGQFSMQTGGQFLVCANTAARW